MNPFTTWLRTGRKWPKRRPEGGFKKVMDWPDHVVCRHPEHNPPGHIVLEPGIYHYTCPGCGHTRRIEIWPRATL